MSLSAHRVPEIVRGFVRVRTVAHVLVIAASLLPLACAQAQSPELAGASVRWLCHMSSACIRKNDDAPLAPWPRVTIDAMHLSCNFCGVQGLISDAYGVGSHQVSGGPQWTGDEVYRVQIALTAPASRVQMLGVLRKVLASAFSLRVRKVSKNVPGYSLVVAPGGIRFPPARQGAKTSAEKGNHLAWSFSTVRQLVDWLNSLYYGFHGTAFGMTRPLRDGTGLRGNYVIPMHWPAPGTNLLAAIAKLGLAARPATVTVTTVTVLHADHLTTSWSGVH